MINHLLKQSLYTIAGLTITKGADNVKKYAVMYFDENDTKSNAYVYIHEYPNNLYDYSVIKFVDGESKVLSEDKNVTETFMKNDFLSTLSHVIVRSRRVKNIPLYNYTKGKFAKVATILDNLDVNEYELVWKHQTQIYVDLLDNPSDKCIKIITARIKNVNDVYRNDITVIDVNGHHYYLDNEQPYSLEAFIKPLFDYQKELLSIKALVKKEFDKERKNLELELKNSNAKLLKLEEDLRNEKLDSKDLYTAQQVIISNLTTKNNNYFDALVFYALPESYDDVFVASRKHNAILRDKGKQAREALNAEELKHRYERDKEILEEVSKGLNEE